VEATLAVVVEVETMVVEVEATVVEVDTSRVVEVMVDREATVVEEGISRVVEEDTVVVTKQLLCGTAALATSACWVLCPMSCLGSLQAMSA